MDPVMTAPAPPLADRQTFLTALQASGLLTAAQFAKAIAAVPAGATTADAVARFLIAAGFLTQFQADRLMAGRADGLVVGPYAILEEVGRGAVGRVYKAKHRTMNRAVAIKVLAAELTSTAAAREWLQREVRAAARLNHPNVVTAYDANEVGDRFYLVLEFVDGPDLDTLVRQSGPLAVAEACEIVRQAACGLQYAHEHGMVHRDVRPANLLAAKASRTIPGCVVKIADFGIARLAPPAGESDALGTPDFVAPELAHDPRLADHRADLYSLGCTFYFLLTGRPPFPDGTAQEKVRRHQFEPPVWVGQLRPDVPPAVAEIVHRLLAKDPNVRYQTAGAVAARLAAPAAGGGAIGDTAGFVTFDLPAVHPGLHSLGSGGLSGTHPVAAADTCPWAQLTDDTAPAATGTDPGDLDLTPVFPRAVGRPAARRPSGLSVWAVAWLCGGAMLTCAAAVGFILRLAGK
jgi:serine/threonine-protein kinase